jgi:hypothetical protein
MAEVDAAVKPAGKERGIECNVKIKVLTWHAILMRGINLYLCPLESLSYVCYCKDYIYIYIERERERERERDCLKDLGMIRI